MQIWTVGDDAVAMQAHSSQRMCPSVQDIDSAGGCAWVREEDMQEISVPFTPFFFCEPKTAFKINLKVKSFFKKKNMTKFIFI